MASENIDFKKGNGLVPVIVQDFDSRDVLMVAYMNEEAWEKTKQTAKPTITAVRAKGRGSKARNPVTFKKSKMFSSTATTTPFCYRFIRWAALHATKVIVVVFTASTPTTIGKSSPSACSTRKKSTKNPNQAD